jgi:hypothetical protein
MIGRRPKIENVVVAALLFSPCIPVPAQAASAPFFSGSLRGEVKNATGIAQMGATVILYNQYDRVVRQVLTDVTGNFNFDSLMPDLYSVRVSLPSFVPAFKRNIAVQPGIQSMLTINLASMLSSIELVSTTPNKGSIMSEDWKWVLRSAQSTRPVLRFHDSDESGRPKYASVFSETRGIVKVSAGDAVSLSSSNSQPDLGTAFALATSLFGSNQLQVSGNVGYSARTGLPVAGFRTTYSRTEAGGSGPDVTVTMRQISLPTRGGFSGYAGQDAGPALRTVSVSTIDSLALGDGIRFEYGVSAETVSLLNRLNTISPFARLTYDLGSAGSVQVGYSSGADPTELIARGATAETGARDASELHQDLAALAALPRVSLRDGRARVQRNNNAEIGYRKVAGSRVYSAGVFRESVRNGALTIAGPDDLFPGDVLPDLGSRSGIIDIGNFSRWGYLATVTQSLGDKLEVAVAYGRGGALTANGRSLATGDADELRDMVKVANKNWASARIGGTAPVSGTHFAASYGWADYRSLIPSHAYVTQVERPEPGLNISIRQPIPSFGLMPGRFEATADLRNLLEQGYLPLSTADRRTLVLTNAPRAVRGGLSFIF